MLFSGIVVVFVDVVGIEGRVVDKYLVAAGIGTVEIVGIGIVAGKTVLVGQIVVVDNFAEAHNSLHFSVEILEFANI